jgi:hypothetical protein
MARREPIPALNREDIEIQRVERRDVLSRRTRSDCSTKLLQVRAERTRLLVSFQSSTWSRCWQAANGWPGFSVADIQMADVLRLLDRFHGLADYPACRAHVARATARPAFAKAHADQMAHFAAVD